MPDVDPETLALHKAAVKMYEARRDEQCASFVQVVPMLHSKRLEGLPRRYALTWAHKDHSGKWTGDYPLKDFRYEIFTEVYDAEVHYDPVRDAKVAENLRAKFLEECEDRYANLFEVSEVPSLQEWVEAGKTASNSGL